MNIAVGPEFVLRGHESPVNCVAFSCGSITEEDALISGSLDGDIKLWSLSSRRAITRTGAHSQSVISVLDMPGNDGAKFLSAGRDECMKLWDINTLTSTAYPVSVFHTGAKHFCNVSSDFYAHKSINTASNIVLSPSANEHCALLWDARTGSVIQKIDIGSEHGMITALHLNSSRAQQYLCSDVLVGLEDGSLTAIDLRMNRKADADSGRIDDPVTSQNVALHDKQPLMCIDASPDGTSVLTGGADQSIHYTSKLSQEQCEKYQNTVYPSIIPVPEKRATLNRPGTSSIKYRPDGRIVVSAHWDHTVRIFDPKKSPLRPLAVLSHHRESVFAVAFSPKGTMFATASKDATIALWTVYSDTYKPKQMSKCSETATGMIDSETPS